MKAGWHILYQVMVKQFYIINAGFFLFLFLFFFGIVQSGQLISYHRSLMMAMISAPLFLYIVLFAWLLYTIKCLLFCIGNIQHNNGSFLFALRALSNVQQGILFGTVSISIYLPVLIYACFFIKVALHENAVATALQVILYQLAMILLCTCSIYQAVNKTSASLLNGVIAKVRKSTAFPVGYYAFILCYISNDRKIAFAVVKTFSLLMLSMLFVRNGDHFDTDLFNIFYPLTITAHAGLVFYCVDFNESLLYVNRNLPLHWLKTAAMFVLTWSLLLLPEAAFMLINNHGNMPVMEIVLQSLTAMATLLLFTGIAYGCSLDMERYLLFVFITYIVVLILQKSVGVPGCLASLTALGLMVLKAHYYSFERGK